MEIIYREKTKIANLNILEIKVNDYSIFPVYYFAGLDYYKPWIDFDFPNDFNVNELINLINGLIPLVKPGGSVMIGYSNEKTTRKMLELGEEPTLTPIGKAMLISGLINIRDWYFPEGWKEGPPKLQGIVPLSKDHLCGYLKQLVQETESKYKVEYIKEKWRTECSVAQR